MKSNTANCQTLIVTFAKPIRVLDNYFDDAEAWGVASLKEWIDGYESTRFTQIGDHTAVITSEYNQGTCKNGCNGISPSPTSYRYRFRPSHIKTSGNPNCRRFSFYSLTQIH